MKTQRTWLRRTLTIGAVVILSAMSMATASAGARSDTAPVGVVSDIGAQADKFTQFTGFGCTYQGVGSTGPTVVVATSVIRGSNCPDAMVRAYVCSGGSCWTTEWRRDDHSAEDYFPSSYDLRSSFHKCDGCVLTHRLNY